MSSPERLQQNFKEEWRPITGYVGLYEVSSFGNVRSLDRKVSYIQRNQYGESNSFKHLKGKLLAKRPTAAGYLRVRLSGKDFYIHRLVAQEFLGSIEGLEINHIDGNKANNNIRNLEIVTRCENHNHAVLNNLNSTANYTRRVLIDGIRYNSIGEASRKLNISYDTIVRRLNGENINPSAANYKYDISVSAW